MEAADSIGLVEGGMRPWDGCSNDTMLSPLGLTGMSGLVQSRLSTYTEYISLKDVPPVSTLTHCLILHCSRMIPNVYGNVSGRKVPFERWVDLLSSHPFHCYYDLTLGSEQWGGSRPFGVLHRSSCCCVKILPPRSQAYE